MKKIILLFIFTSFSSFANENYKDIQGQYYLDGATMIDTPKNEASDTHLYFRLMGNAAKDMCENMQSEALEGICSDEDMLVKSAGNIICEFDPNDKSHTCFFSLDINKNSIGSGFVY